MYEQKFVVFRERQNKNTGPAEQYWRGHVGKRLNEIVTPKILKAKTFDTYEEARVVVNTLVNQEFLPPAALDMKIAMRMIADDENIMFNSKAEGHATVPGFKGTPAWQMEKSGG